jgi:hypothetical protein
LNIAKMQLDEKICEVAHAKALLAIVDERRRQDLKWGVQNHDAGTWALILLEEIGEWAKAELQTRYGGPEAGRQHEEAVHAAAVAMAIVECMERKHGAESMEHGAK